jgi:hypothetical protein
VSSTARPARPPPETEIEGRRRHPEKTTYPPDNQMTCEANLTGNN